MLHLSQGYFCFRIQKYSKMKIAELLTLPEAANLTVQVSIGDLRLFHEEIVQKQLSQQKELTKTEDELLTVTEAMSFLKVSRTSLFRWQKNGYLEPIKTGGRCRYRKSDIEAILSQGRA